MHETTGMGMGLCFAGMGWNGIVKWMGCCWDGSQPKSGVYGDGIGMEKIIGDGSGMGLIFTIVSLLVRD